MTEREVLSGVRSGDVEPVGLVEHVGVAVGGAQQEEQPCVGWDRHAPDLGIDRCLPAPGEHRAVEAEHLLDRVRDQRWIVDQRLPRLPAGQELPERVAQQAGRRFVAGEQQVESPPLPPSDCVSRSSSSRRAVSRALR